MDTSERIGEIQLRFQAAARIGKGLTLSPEDVALLASLEPEEEPPQQIELALEPVANTSADYQRALSIIPQSNPITINQNGTPCCIVWSLFLHYLNQWSSTGTWTFEANRLVVQYNGVTSIVPTLPQPLTPHVEKYDSESQCSPSRVQDHPRTNGEGRLTFAGRAG